MVGVMSWHWDFWGCSTPIHEGNTIGRAVAVGRFLVMWVGDDLLLAACRQAGSARPQACPAYAVTTGVVQVGWVTLLLAGTRRGAPDLHYRTGQGGTGILRGSAMPRIMAHDPIPAVSTQILERTQPRGEADSLGRRGGKARD